MYASLALAVHNRGIAIGHHRYAGTACPQGSVGASLSPDGSAISVLFSDFVVTAGSDKQRDSKGCTIDIPVTIPEGFRLSVAQFDYRGFQQIPAGARANLAVRYAFMQHGAGHLHEHPFTGPKSMNYLVTDKIERSVRHRTSCQARQATLRLTPQIDLRTNANREQTMLTLDSADANGFGIKYVLELEPCS